VPGNPPHRDPSPLPFFFFFFLLFYWFVKDTNVALNLEARLGSLRSLLNQQTEKPLFFFFSPLLFPPPLLHEDMRNARFLAGRMSRLSSLGSLGGPPFRAFSLREESPPLIPSFFFFFLFPLRVSPRGGDFKFQFRLHDGLRHAVSLPFPPLPDRFFVVNNKRLEHPSFPFPFPQPFRLPNG